MQLPPWTDLVFFALCPFLFAGMWLAVGARLGTTSQWFDLARRYPDRAEAPLVRLAAQSGKMAGRVSFSRCLNLSACPSGLRVGIALWLGPQYRRFLVPWCELAAGETRNGVELRFGKPPDGTLVISAEAANKLARAASGFWPGQSSFSEPSVGVTLGRIWLGWAVVSAFAGVFFNISQLTWPAESRAPALLLFLFPAVFFGIGPVFRTVVFLLKRRRA